MRFYSKACRAWQIRKSNNNDKDGRGCRFSGSLLIMIMIRMGGRPGGRRG
jgi:hypothetical protein